MIHTRRRERPPAKFGPQSQVVQSMVCNGAIVRGRVERSVLSPGVYVSPGAVVRDSVVMNDVWIGPGAVLDRGDCGQERGGGRGRAAGLGGDDLGTPNKQEPDKINTGVTVVGKGAHLPANIRVGRNVVINADRDEEHFSSGEVASGETI